MTIKRILSIPRDDRDGEDLVDELTSLWRRPGGTWLLHPHQALALQYMQELGRGFFAMDVGAGKTLIAMLAHRAFGIEPHEVTVLTAAPLVKEAHAEAAIYSQQFDFGMPNYVSYSKVSRNYELLDELAPKVIVADEAHCLGNKKSARTKRFLKYMKSSDAHFIPMSATFAKTNLEEYYHLMKLALGVFTPLPSGFGTRQGWAAILDEDPTVEMMPHHFGMMQPLLEAFGQDESLPIVRQMRQAYRSRLHATPGFVIVDESSCDQPLHIELLTDIGFDASDDIKRAKEWFELPNEDIILDPMRATQAAKQLALGFYYWRDWEGEPNHAWDEARRTFQAVLNSSTRGRFDTPARALEGYLNGEFKSIALGEAYDRWMDIAETESPVRRANWQSDEVLRWVDGEAGPQTIIWYSHRAVARRAEDLGFNVCWPGERPTPGKAVWLSTFSHSKGLNLQAWNENIVLTSPSNHATWQQLVGRTHRQGQTSAVKVRVLAHTAELRGAWENARRKALAYQDNFGIQQKILHAHLTTI